MYLVDKYVGLLACHLNKNQLLLTFLEASLEEAWWYLRRNGHGQFLVTVLLAVYGRG